MSGPRIPLGFDQLTLGLESILLKRLADLIVAGVDAGRRQVAEHLADYVLVTGFLVVRADNVLRLGVALGLGQAHRVRSPLAEQAVAAGDQPKLHFLIVRELGFERALTIVKGTHSASFTCLAREIGRRTLRGNAPISRRRESRRVDIALPRLSCSQQVN